MQPWVMRSATGIHQVTNPQRASPSGHCGHPIAGEHDGLSCTHQEWASQHRTASLIASTRRLSASYDVNASVQTNLPTISHRDPVEMCAGCREKGRR
jgi:hypothetical protein